MSDLINRQDAIDALDCSMTITGRKNAETVFEHMRSIRDRIKALPSAEPKWIPFKTRELTDEEREEHPEWCFIVDCELPENGQEILVSINVSGHERVQFDEFYDDDGIYLDSGYEIGMEAVAWMPLPEPYKEKKHE